MVLPAHARASEWEPELTTLRPMLTPYDPTSIVAYAVTRAVNGVKNSWLTRCA